jgi:hypothetical protein
MFCTEQWRIVDYDYDYVLELPYKSVKVFVTGFVVWVLVQFCYSESHVQKLYYYNLKRLTLQISAMTMSIFSTYTKNVWLQVIIML